MTLLAEQRELQRNLRKLERTLARTSRNVKKAEETIMAVSGTDLSSIAIKWSEAKSFEPINEAGTYEAIFSGGKVKDNKDKTAKKYTAEFVVDDETSEFHGRKAFRDYSLQSNALWALKKMLMACGVDEDEFTDDANLGLLIDQANGARVLITIVMNPDRNNPDKLYSNVDEVSPVN